MPATLSSELVNASHWAEVYESRLEEFGKHYSECAHVTQKELKLRDRDIKRETYTQVLAWHTEGDQDCRFTLDRVRMALAGLDEMDPVGEGGAAPAPAPPSSPGNRGPTPFAAALQMPLAALQGTRSGGQSTARADKMPPDVVTVNFAA